MAARLIAETGQYEGAEYPLGGNGAVLGRLKSNDIEVADTKASRRHTRVGWAEGSWFVEDLKSSNGTFLNGAQVDRAEITTGDKISIGKTVYRFEADDESGMVAPPPVSRPKAKARSATEAKRAAKPTARQRTPAETIEPEELHLEEPEELGLDEPAAAAPSAPAAPRAPAAPDPPPAKRQVSATGHGIVSLTSGPAGKRSGLLGGDVGQRDWRFQLIVYVAAIAFFVALTWGAFALMDGVLGDPEAAQAVTPPATTDPAGTGN